MSERSGTLSSLPEWQAAGLRLTAFPGVPSGISGEAWWEEVVGQPPEQTTRQRSGEVQVVGLLGSGKLVLSIDLVRIDWRLLSVEEGLTLSDSVASLGTFSQTIEEFLSLMSKWLDSREHEVNRLAFGAELLLPVENHSDGYRHLSSYLHSVNLDPEGSSDFLYQINRSRVSQTGVSDLRINRLTKWSVGKLGRIVLLPNGHIMELAGAERYFCRLELDINTAQDFNGTLPRDKLVVVFQELVDLSKEIAMKGDVP